MIKIIFPHTMVQDQISFQFYRKITFNTKKDLLDQGVLPLVNVLVLYFSSSFSIFFLSFLFLKVYNHDISLSLKHPPPPHTHTHTRSETEQVHCLNKDWRSRYLLCLDIGHTFLWMKRRSINYKIKNTCSHAHGYCMNTPLTEKESIYH